MESSSSDGASSSSSSLSDDNTQDTTCYMCIKPGKGITIPFSEKTWGTFLRFVPKWQSLEGEQAEIAKDFITRVAHGTDYATTTIPPNGGFHRTCYSRFTDSQRLKRAITKTEKETGKFFFFISCRDP